MAIYATIDGKDYELQITAREIINDGMTYALLSDSETRELLHNTPACLENSKKADRKRLFTT